MIRLFKHYLAKRRLKAITKPNPEYRKRRLAQFSPERRERYYANVRAVFGEVG